MRSSTVPFLETSFDRDSKTLLVLSNSKHWRQVMRCYSLMTFAKVGPISVEELSDAEHEWIRAWAEQPTIGPMPEVLIRYVDTLEKARTDR